MLGSLVAALRQWTGQAAAASTHAHPPTSPSQPMNQGATAAATSATPWKPFVGQTSSGDPFVTPAPVRPRQVHTPPTDTPPHDAQAQAQAQAEAARSDVAPAVPSMATPQSTPVPRVLFTRANGAARRNGHAVGRRGPVAAAPVAPWAAETEVQVRPSQPSSEEDKENGPSMHPARTATATTGGAAPAAAHKRAADGGGGHGRNESNGSDALESEMGRTLKRMKVSDDAATTASAHHADASGGVRAARGAGARPAAHTRSLSGLGSVATADASIFNFGQLHPQQRHAAAAPLFTSKLRAGGLAAKHAARPTHSRSHSSASADHLSSSLGGFQISNGAAEAPVAPAAASPSVQVDDAAMEDVDMVVSPRANSQPSATTGGTRSDVPSPSHALDMPLHSLAISNSISAGAFRSLSLADAATPNPFLSAAQKAANASRPPAAAAANAAAAVDAADTAARIAAFKQNSGRRGQENMAQMKRDRTAALAAAAKAEAAAERQSQGGAAASHRADIKTATRSAINPAHLPLRNNNAMRARSSVAAASSAAASAAPTRPPVPLFGAATQPSSQRAGERDRVPITATASQTGEREAERRAERLQRAEAEQRRAREQSQQAARAALAAKEAQLRQQQQESAQRDATAELQRQQSAQRSAQRAAQEAAVSDRPAGLRRSSRHSGSPAAAVFAAAASLSSSPSPSPSPPASASASESAPPSHTVKTPSPRNRFAAPPMSAEAPTPVPRTRSAAAAAAAAATAGATSRASSPAAAARVASPPVSRSQASAAAAAQSAAHLAASIAARKAADSAAAASRLRDRQAAMQQQERAEAAAARERDQWQERVARNVAQRARGKGYLDLLREFAPAIRAAMPAPAGPYARPDYDAQRKAMRKAMAKFHPDKHTSSPTKNKLEAEEIFVLLKKAYDELCTLCK